MSGYKFYLPGCDEVVELSKDDWLFLSELALEEGAAPEVFAAQILSSELARYRDEIAYAEEVRQEIIELINQSN